MPDGISSARALLDAAYEGLYFNEGALLDASASPNQLTSEQWIEKGDWLSLAGTVGAEKVFFVNNNPVIVFAKSEASDAETLRLFNKVWCMSRPMFLFIARDGLLAIHKLARPPVRTVEEWRTEQPLKSVTHANAVATHLKAYRREQIESGRLFEDDRFGTSHQRADQLLINDLKTVRAGLMAAGLKDDNLKYAHALIGRSIFIRYLEDRGILPREYFYEELAENNLEWQHLLESPLSKPEVNPEMEEKLYPRVLANHDFTYALFDKLANDFNGDMFLSDPREREIVNQTHLNLLQRFLRGDADPQQRLFFWAYKFDIIPVELISNIYEEFYHKEKGKTDKNGTHYTPGALVDFVLSQILTKELLETSPRILDPACGSGIFLVEAFRRIVRFHIHKRDGERLNARELREILRDQIAGIEINEEAVRVAAFSLYLALLHYQEPPSILEQIKQGMRLPHLLYQENQLVDEFNFNNLLCANAFSVRLGTADRNRPLPFMDEVTYPSFIAKPIDIVVGNPPWGQIDKDEKDVVLKWCESRGCPVGDEEYSQAFIWKTLDLLKDGGYAGLLVSTGVFYKHHAKSIEFRQKWLQECRLIEVVNFAHVRGVFFREGNAPFASVVFQKLPREFLTNSKQVVRYWSAKKLAHVDRWQAVVLTRADLRLVSQDDLRHDDKLWKIYWWGNDRDRALIEWLEVFTPLREISDEKGKRITKDLNGRGFQENQNPKLKKLVDWFGKYKEFPTKNFERYGPFDKSKLCAAPPTVEHPGKEELYKGERLLIQRGIMDSSNPKGRIIARLESASFSFRNSIHAIKLRDGQSWEYKTLLAIFWSSLARYYYFLTNSNWGMWHFELHLGEIGRMPIRFPEDKGLRDRITDVVDQLRSWKPVHYSLLELEGKTEEQLRDEITELERRLDEAVFDLYELSKPERDQITDMCNIGIEFFYKDYHSEAAKSVNKTQVTQGLYKNVSSIRENRKELYDYLRVFLQIWNRELDDPGSEFSWSVVQPEGDWPMIAVTFSIHSKGEPLREPSGSERQQWSDVLRSLGENLLVPYKSERVYIDGMVRAATETYITIIKRNEKRLWTRSMAREDAEATMVQVMNLRQSEQGESSETKNYPHQPEALAES